MKRTLVIGDIHGGFKALEQVLHRANVTPEDKLIFLGDYVDGWSDSSRVISYLIGLQHKNECIFVKGNHDKWCEDWIKTSDSNPIWLFHGGKSTVESYKDISDSEKMQHLRFFQSMIHYYVDDSNRLFIHAGFSSMHGVEKEPYESNYSWDRTLWELALVMKDNPIPENSPFYPKRLSHYTKIFIGHTPTTNYKIDIPIKADKLINMDTGAAFKGTLTIMDIESEEFWQSDALPLLYPTEKGRN